MNYLARPLVDGFGICVEATESCSIADVPIDTMKSQLRQHGAILFRRFDVTLDVFATWTKTFMVPLVHGGDRKLATPDGTVKHVNEGQGRIPLHCELAYAPLRPDICFFCCAVAPQQGGETTIGDGRRVFDALRRDTQALLSKHRISYKHRQPATFWRRSFGVQTREEAAPMFEFIKAKVAMAGFRVDYRFDAEDTIHLEYVCPAVFKTAGGESVFADSLQLFARAAQGRTFRTTRGPASWATFEDGTPVPEEILDEIDALFDRSELSVPWQSSDVLMLDNWTVLHGRRAFDSPRTIYNSFGYAPWLTEGRASVLRLGDAPSADHN